jgi:uncharacterized membrane protein
VGGVLTLLLAGIQIVVLVPPMLIILSLLIFRKNQTESDRFFIFIASLGILLTLLVELVALKGDIGRMNTVFKFYLQAWTFLSISSAYFLYRIAQDVTTEWNNKWRTVWVTTLIILIMSAASFPVLATIDKVNDRMANHVPITLDGMDFMQYAHYSEENISMDLSQDYHAILWLQENVKGSPVIVEANVPEYRWGNRYTIYTGLPGVVGWNWHQRQQKAILPSNWVTDRIDEIRNFYSTNEKNQIIEFLKKYQVSYIIVGQLEKMVYPGEGLDKFINLEGDIWNSIYHDQDTSIYKVNENILR